MAAPVDPDRVASVIVEAAISGDAPTCERNGISTRTLRRYRERMDRDPDVSASVRVKKQAVTDKWSADLAGAIKDAISFIKRACVEADPTDPAALHSVNGSLKILSDVAQAERFLDARLGPPPSSDGADGGDDSESSGAPSGDGANAERH